MNVHFAPEAVLEGLFRHYGEPAGNLTRLLANRRGAELTQADLQELLRDRDRAGAARWRPSWACRPGSGGSASKAGTRRLSWVVARVPREDGLPEYRRLEESR